MSSIEGPTPEAVAEAKRELVFEIDETQFQMWRHEPITAAFLQFLADQLQVWRELAGHCVEHGYFHAHDSNEDRNPDVVRGKIIAFRDLHQIDLEGIQRFYRQDEPEEPQAGRPREVDDE